MKVCGLDLESTGLDWEKGARIIEVCAIVWRVQDRRELLNFTRRINPDGARIEAKAQAVHGISAADLVAAPKFSAVSKPLLSILNGVDLIFTFNGESFDIPFLVHELINAGETPPSNIMHMDLMREGMGASFDSKPPSLREMCWALGVEYDLTQAHQAVYDVRVMGQCLFRGLDEGYFKLPTNVTQE